MKHQKFLIAGGLFNKVICTAILFTFLTGFKTILIGTALAGTYGFNLLSSYAVPEKYSGEDAAVSGTAVSVADVSTGDPKCTGVPTVVTKPATDITATCATLKGTVNPTPEVPITGLNGAQVLSMEIRPPRNMRAEGHLT